MTEEAGHLLAHLFRIVRREYPGIEVGQATAILCDRGWLEAVHVENGGHGWYLTPAGRRAAEGHIQRYHHDDRGHQLGIA
jgi:hypothetical protein